MPTSLLKPIRVPQNIPEEDKEYLARKRIKQNFSHQATIYVLECIRKHDEIPEKYWVSAIDAVRCYLFNLEKQAKEELSKEQTND